MRPSARHSRTPRRRGAVLLEFVMVLPLFLFMMFLSLDLGHLMFVYGASEDATYTAARAAAQAGGASQGNATETFYRAIDAVPTLSRSRASFAVPDGDCSDTPIIQVEGTVTLDTITPGLDALYQLATGSTSTGLQGLPITTRAVVLCEVVR